MNNPNRFARFVLSSLIILVISAQSFAQFKLTVLHNNDGESKLLNAGTGNLVNFGGVSRFKTLLDSLRAQSGSANIPSIMLAAGDNTLAGPEFYVSQQLPYGTPFYDVVAMNSFDYDAICIGNHDFDFGPDLLARIIRDFQPLPQAPWLCANADFSGEDSLQALVNSGRIAPTKVLNINGVQVGIIGAITPRLPFISSPGNVVIDTNVANIVQSQVNTLTNNGVGIIILISHLQTIKEDSALCRRISGVDIMVGGGGSEVLANQGDLLVPGDLVYGSYPYYVPNLNNVNVPLITTEGAYKYIGKFTGEFDNLGNLISVDTSSGPVRVAGGSNPDSVTRNAQLVSDVDVPITAGLAGLASNVLAQTNTALDGRRTAVRTKETNLGNLIADAFLWSASQSASNGSGLPVPDIALQNGGGIRNNSIIPAGNFSELNAFAVLPFANFLSIVPNVPRSQVKEILENAISNIAQTDGRFAQVGGLRVEYNLQGQRQIVDNDGNVLTPGTRVRNAEVVNQTNGISYPIVQNGEVVPGPGINIATIDFLARGGDQYPFRGAPFTNLAISYTGALIDYLQNGLGGVVDSAQYPLTGSGRITILDVPLPVELASFTSSVSGRNVTLNWSTSSELNSMAFDVERSAESGSWIKVGSVSGSGTTNEIRNYTFEDRNLNTGRYTYRLKQIDFNGEFEYHNMTGEVVIGIPAVFSLSQNYPNPFNPTTKINYDVPAETFVTLKIFDIAGNEIMTLVNEKVSAGSYSVTFSGANLSSGMYIYRLLAGDFSATRKMTLIK
ncbi:MAG: 5'-nucleotidase C-terminal domain-containing protein [Ignavibacteria bacterium]|nr:5'-nucleotidase C-terminal domain-containing protein [Ignavibacteria bacterium]